MAFTELLDQSLLSELRRIEIRTRRTIDSDLMGRYRTAFRGSGLVFSDLREYQPGDEIKSIHWKVTARTGIPHVKTFDEDRLLNIVLTVDMTRSLIAGGGRTKHRKALELSALLAMLGHKGQDSVGLCLFSNRVEEFLAAKRSRGQVQRIISSLLTHRELASATDLRPVITHLRKNLKRASVIFLISDFFCQDFADELRMLAYKHDVIGCLLKSSFEVNLPRAGIVEFADSESGERILVDLSSKKVASELVALQENRLQKLRELFKGCRADLIEIEDNVLKPLAELMSRRTKRH